MAKLLNMKFEPKLNWEPGFMPISNRDKVRKLTGYADRNEYLEIEAKHYRRHQCYEMWFSPQINWDGKLLGCSRNFYGVYEENVFETGFQSSVNNEKIRHAREILMGKKPQLPEFPCIHCRVYKNMIDKDNYITDRELAEARERVIWHIST